MKIKKIIIYISVLFLVMILHFTKNTKNKEPTMKSTEVTQKATETTTEIIIEATTEATTETIEEIEKRVRQFNQKNLDNEFKKLPPKNIQ